MDAKGRCPDCNRPISFNPYLEIVRCPWCKQAFPPEFLRPL